MHLADSSGRRLFYGIMGHSSSCSASLWSAPTWNDRYAISVLMWFFNGILTHLDFDNAQHVSFQYLSISLALPQIPQPTLLRSCSRICFSRRNTMRYPTKDSIAACGSAMEGIFHVTLHNDTYKYESCHFPSTFHTAWLKRRQFILCTVLPTDCINNHTAYQIHSVTCMKQVRKRRLWSDKLTIPAQKHSKQNAPEKNLPISCHLIFFLLSISHHLMNKEAEVLHRKTTHFKKSTLGLNHLPEHRGTTLFCNHHETAATLQLLP